MRVAAAVAVLVLSVTSGAALAQVTPEQQSAIRSNCRSDFMSKCSGVTPGGREALTCLQTNVATLSGGCKAAVSATIPKPAEPAPPPKAETPKPAPAPVATAPAAAPPAVPETKPTAATEAPTPPKTSKPKAAAKPKPPATKTATAPTTPPPSAAAPAAPPPDPNPVDAAVLIRACKLDMFRYCKDVAFGEGRKLACLNANQARLTVRCRTALNVTAPLR